MENHRNFLSMHVHMSPVRTGLLFGIIAAVLTAFSPALCKLCVTEISPVMAAACMNLGAGLGVGILMLILKKTPVQKNEQHLQKSDIPWLIGICISELMATVAMMAGLSFTTAATSSLLSNFETVAVAVLALVIFKEIISRRVWLGIILITAGCVLLSAGDISEFVFSPGSLLVLLACVLWGLENNFTKRLAHRNPMEIVVCKGLIPGIITLGIALALGNPIPSVLLVLAALGVGFLVYGLNIVFLVASERHLGAAKACAIYGINPFLAAVVSCLIFAEIPSFLFVVSGIVMIVGLYFVVAVGRNRRKNTDG